jgi:hypothetical protein
VWILLKRIEPRLRPEHGSRTWEDSRLAAERTTTSARRWQRSRWWSLSCPSFPRIRVVLCQASPPGMQRLSGSPHSKNGSRQTLDSSPSSLLLRLPPPSSRTLVDGGVGARCRPQMLALAVAAAPISNKIAVSPQPLAGLGSGEGSLLCDASPPIRSLWISSPPGRHEGTERIAASVSWQLAKSTVYPVWRVKNQDRSMRGIHSRLYLLRAISKVQHTPRVHRHKLSDAELSFTI